MPTTAQLFYETVRDSAVKATISAARQALAKGDRAGYDRLKRSLPAFIFMATFQPNKGKDNTRPEAAWRLQRAVRLNGLVMLDIDHIDNPAEVFDRVVRTSHLMDDGHANELMLAHVTPSGQGLRLVCTADVMRGNLADNQQLIAMVLGLECDKAVKNADRMSFACTEEDILFINPKIFDYDNPEYDKTFGENYRHGASAPAETGAAAGKGGNDTARGTDLPTVADGEQDDEKITLPRSEDGTYVYRNTTYRSIVNAWLEQCGTPVVGERHQCLLRLAGDMRYLCDNRPANVMAVVSMAPFVEQMIAEGARQEVLNVCRDVCQRRSYLNLPQTLRKVMATLGQQQEATDAMCPDNSLYEQLAGRLRPLIGTPYDLATYNVEDGNWLGAIFAAGAMFCTLLTRCCYKHFDGAMHRMNPQVLIIGDPASGKSFADRLDRLIMEPVRAADRMGREAEAEYKEKAKERATSSKAQKGEALKRPEFCIRYLPSRTSNAVFFRRAKNAKEEVNGEMQQLHLYTFDSELDSNTTAQSSGAWIGKHDIELKAFQNEWTGVDFANSDSVNDIIQVFYNTVATGTPVSLQRKFNVRNINDGLCSRVAIFRMHPTSYRMIARGQQTVNNEKETALRQLAYKMDKLHGELKIERLVDHVYNLCELAAFTAEASSDLVLDFLRKRSVFYAIWFTVPRIVARAISDAEAQKVDDAMELVTVTDDDLKFAEVMFDSVIYWQDYFFGQMLQESWDNANSQLVQRRRKAKNDGVFALLPDVFSAADAEKTMHMSRAAVQMQLKRWVDAGALKKTKHNEYKKTTKML